MATVLIRNLPDRVDESRLTEVLGGPERVTSIEFKEDPNPTTSLRQAIVTLDMTPYEAEQIVTKYQGMILEGRPMRISVIHFMA
jgi:RNA recognition motif-containing protein